MTQFISPEVPISITTFDGGLNTGTLQLKDSETNDLQNVEFMKFGSIKKRLGYYYLNELVIGTSTGMGLFTFEMPHVLLNHETHIGYVIT